jgi:hypothetical protein
VYCPNPQCSDRIATGRPGEYRDEIYTCPVCGTRLERGSWEDVEPTSRTSRGPAGEVGGADVELLRTRSTQEADVVAGALDGERIPFRRWVESPDGSPLAAGVAVVAQGTEQVLLVPETCFRRASIVMADVLRAEPVFDDGYPWADTEGEPSQGVGEEGDTPGGTDAVVLRAVVLTILFSAFVALLWVVFGSS